MSRDGRDDGGGSGGRDNSGSGDDSGSGGDRNSGRIRRRALLGALAGLPVIGGVVYWWSRWGRRRDPGAAASPDDPQTGGTAPQARDLADALAIVVTAIGPWRPGDREVAAALVGQFVGQHVGQFAGRDAEQDREPARAIASLARRLGPDAYAVDDIDLAALSPAERDALLALTRDLYAALPVRYYAVGEPPPGTCVGDPSWHTQAPEPTPEPTPVPQ
jgi:hypothetical protein